MTVAVGNGVDAHLIHCRRPDRGCLVAAILMTAGRIWPTSLMAGIRGGMR
jgi:hypothetical protein